MVVVGKVPCLLGSMISRPTPAKGMVTRAELDAVHRDTDWARTLDAFYRLGHELKVPRPSSVELGAGWL